MATFKLPDPRYLAPNALTAASLLLAVASMVESMRGDFTLAAWMIVWCALLDIADGQVARWLRATSDFGMQLDSLSDLVAFGVAPAVLVYGILTTDPRYFDVYAATLPRLGLAVCMGAYVLATALRLARYNLETRDERGAGFTGIPSTVAGAMLVTYLLAAWELALPAGIVKFVPVLMLALAGLMMGTFRLVRAASPRRHGSSVLLIGVLLVYTLGFSRTLPSVLFAIAAALCVRGIVAGMGRGAPGMVESNADVSGKAPRGEAPSRGAPASTSPGNAAGAGP